MKLIVVYYLFLLIFPQTYQQKIISELLAPAGGKIIDKAIETFEKFCIEDDNCYDGFFKIKNYCCKKQIVSQCCNVLDFIFVDNGLQSAIENPRPINIILFIIAIFSLPLLFCFYLCCKKCLSSYIKIRYTNFQNQNILI
jgi:hypothetical protein